MTALLSPPGVSGLAHARDMPGAAARVELWSLTDRQLAVEVADAADPAGGGRRGKREFTLSPEPTGPVG